jgi:hypothetical protein
MRLTPRWSQRRLFFVLHFEANLRWRSFALWLSFRPLGRFTRMELEQPDPSWKVQLRYGKIQTPFRHFTALAEGTVGELADGFECPPGRAFMGMNTWASSTDESADMIRVIGKQIGFTITGNIRIYETEPQQPPREKPYGYDITFTPFDPDA